MNTEELFADMTEFSAKLSRAETRCREIAQQEDLLGYAESARTYFSMRGEIFCARIWVQEVLGSRIGEVW